MVFKTLQILFPMAKVFTAESMILFIILCEYKYIINWKVLYKCNWNEDKIRFMIDNKQRDAPFT